MVLPTSSPMNLFLIVGIVIYHTTGEPRMPLNHVIEESQHNIQGIPLHPGKFEYSPTSICRTKKSAD